MRMPFSDEQFRLLPENTDVGGHILSAGTLQRKVRVLRKSLDGGKAVVHDCDPKRRIQHIGQEAAGTAGIEKDMVAVADQIGGCLGDLSLLLQVHTSKNKIIRSSELIEIIEARVEQIFSIINKDLMQAGMKSKINNVILTGRGITNISKSDVAGKVALNIPVKFATGKQTSSIKPSERTAYSLVKYIASRPFAKSVSSRIDESTNDNVLKKVVEKVKDFFYS